MEQQYDALEFLDLMYEPAFCMVHACMFAMVSQ